MNKSIFGIVKGQRHAENIIKQLRNAGFTSESVSIFYTDYQDKKSLELARKTSSTGEVGSYMAQGPILDALSHTHGEPNNQIAKAIMHFGVASHIAEKISYEINRQNHALVIVKAQSSQDADQARLLLHRNNVEQIIIA